MGKNAKSGRKTLEKRTLGERLLRPFGASVTGRRGYRVEIEGLTQKKRLLVSGARRILEAGEERVLLVLEHERLSVLGRGLCCLTYDGGIAEIEGDITEILFLNGDKKE